MTLYCVGFMPASTVLPPQTKTLNASCYQLNVFISPNLHGGLIPRVMVLGRESLGDMIKGFR